jgi:hypothetical protein
VKALHKVKIDKGQTIKSSNYGIGLIPLIVNKGVQDE